MPYTIVLQVNHVTTFYRAFYSLSSAAAIYSGKRQRITTCQFSCLSFRYTYAAFTEQNTLKTVIYAKFLSRLISIKSYRWTNLAREM